MYDPNTLTEIDQRILAELEEAGEESVLTLAVTVLDGKGTPDELDNFKRSLTSLARQGLVRLSVGLGRDGRLEPMSIEASISEIDGISSFLMFDANRGLWQDKRRLGPPFGPNYPYVVYANTGRDVAVNILNSRGYQWWRRK
jgi:hypothetical protein